MDDDLATLLSDFRRHSDGLANNDMKFINAAETQVELDALLVQAVRDLNTTVKSMCTEQAPGSSKAEVLRGWTRALRVDDGKG